jgi:hypothetical protein
MKKFGFATIAATALTAGFLGFTAPALAAPSGAGSAQDTISSLEDQGYKVIVNRLSNTPLDQASVVSVGEGPTFSKSLSGDTNRNGYAGPDRRYVPDNVKTIHVNVK